MCVDTARQRSGIPISISTEPLNEEKRRGVLFCQTPCLKPLKISHLHSLGPASHSSVLYVGQWQPASHLPLFVDSLLGETCTHGRGREMGFAALKMDPLWINYGTTLEDLLQPFTAEKPLFSGSCSPLLSSPLSRVCVWCGAVITPFRPQHYLAAGLPLPRSTRLS